MVVLLAEQRPQIPSELALRKGRTGISVWAAPAFLFSGSDAVDIQQPALSPGKASEFAMQCVGAQPPWSAVSQETGPVELGLPGQLASAPGRKASRWVAAAEPQAAIDSD
jgi:hypothetical protein